MERGKGQWSQDVREVARRQRAARKVSHHQIGLSGGHPYVIDGQDVRMLQTGDNPRPRSKRLRKATWRA